MNRFRPQYRELSEAEKDLVNRIKTKAEELEQLYLEANNHISSRYHSLALTSLEESVMWIVKEITK